MSHVDSSVVIHDVEGSWSADAGRGKGVGGGGEGKGEENERREAHEGQFLALITESDRKSGSVCVMWVEGKVVSVYVGL